MSYPKKLSVNKNIADSKLLFSDYYNSNEYFHKSIDNIFLRSWQFVNHKKLINHKIVPFYFMKDLIDAYPEPKPANTTVATLLKRMRDKKFVDFVQYGRSREYFPLVKKTDYFSKQMNGLIKNFFNNSAAQFASFFTEETDLSEEELKELRKIIDERIKNQ